MKDQLQLYPLLRVLIPLCIGIIAGDFFSYFSDNLFSYHISPDVWFVGLIICCLSAIVLYRQAVLQTLAMMFFFAFLGGYLLTGQERDNDFRWSENEMEYQAEIVGIPIVKDKVVECDLRIVNLPDGTPLVKSYILKDYCSVKLKVGEGIIVRSLVVRPYNFYRNAKFDYAEYLRKHGFSGTTFIYADNWEKASIDLSALSFVERAKITFFRLRDKLLVRYRNLGFEGQRLAVLSAMTLGDKSLLSRDVKHDFSVAGASHILALSGLHLSIIYTVLSMILIGRRRRFLSSLFVLMSVWAFVFIVGLSPSVTRSAIMLTIYSFLSLLHRDKISVNALIFTAVIMLAVNPFSLYDVGFQLSFLAVLSIQLFYQPVSSIIHADFQQRHRVLRWIWQMISVSIAAQVCTFPLVMYYFGTYSCYFMLTNLVVVPCATLVIYLALAMMIFFFWNMMQYYISVVLSKVLLVMMASIKVISVLPGASIDKLSPSPIQVVTIYIMILAAYMFLLSHTYRRLLGLMTSVMLLLIVLILK